MEMMAMKNLSVAIAVLSVALSVRATEYYASSSASAAEEHDCLSEGTAGTIIEAFGKATTDGDIVTLLDGTYDMTKFAVKSTVINTPKEKNATSPSYLVGKNAITVRSKSGDREAVTLLGGGKATDGRCFWFNAAATISGLTVTNFYSAKAAAAVYSENRSLFVTNCVLSGNRSARNIAVGYRLRAADCEMNGNYAGFARCIGEELDLINCTFDNNGATGGSSSMNEYVGGLVYNSSLTGCTFRYLYLDTNVGIPAGTAVSACALTNCTFRDTKINYAVNNDRKALCHNSTLKGCHFRNLQISDYSGGCLDQSTAEDCVFTNVVNYFGQKGSCARNSTCRGCTFVDNILTNCENGITGGGACYGGSFYNCKFFRNTAVSAKNYSEPHGGAICGFSVISNCVFVGNAAAYGGAVAAATTSYAFSPDAMIYDSYFTNNLARRIGGAAYGATLDHCEVHGCEVTWCTTSQGGGGAYNCRSINSLFEYCKLTEASTSSRGGGAQYGGSAVNCVFRYNTETNDPAVSVNTATAAACDAVALTNCLFYGNYIYPGDNGGAIIQAWTPAVNCTVVSNTVGTARGACMGRFVNCIVADNVRDFYNRNHASYASTVLTNCLYKTLGSGTITKTNCLQVESVEKVRFASLDPASENAFRLRRGSPARNAGADVGFTSADVDLAGNLRVVGDKVDMGCYEYFINNGLVIILK